MPLYLAFICSVGPSLITLLAASIYIRCAFVRKSATCVTQKGCKYDFQHIYPFCSIQSMQYTTEREGTPINYLYVWRHHDVSKSWEQVRSRGGCFANHPLLTGRSGWSNIVFDTRCKLSVGMCKIMQDLSNTWYGVRYKIIYNHRDHNDEPAPPPPPPPPPTHPPPPPAKKKIYDEP